MAAKTKENPYGVDPARDLPHATVPVDIPMWNENCFFSGFDAEHGILFYHHMGRVADDPYQWCGDFCLGLPDGRLLFSKTFGRHDDTRGMGSGSLTFDCMEPLRQWRLRFQGVAFLTTQDENRRRFSGLDQYPVPTEFDIMWEAVAPIYHAKHSGEALDDLAKDGHYEQLGNFKGFVRTFDTVSPLRGTGYRDHSVGPRDFNLFTGHVFNGVAFRRSGRGFGMLALDEGNRHGAQTAYVVENGELTTADYVSGPAWAQGATDFDHKSYDLVLRTKDKEHLITAEVLDHGYYWTYLPPSQMAAGIDPHRMVDEKHIVCKEAVVKYTWDGEEDYGLLETSRRLGL